MGKKRTIAFIVVSGLLAAALVYQKSDESAVDTGLAPVAASGPPAATKQPVPSIGNVRQGGSSPWQEVDPDGKTVLPNRWKDAPGARLVALDRSLLRDVVAGETVELAIPQLSLVFTAEVEHAEARPSGSLSLRGHINGDLRFGFVMTLGDDSTFATIGTPDGIYNLAGDGDMAWIVAQRELDQRIDPQKPDYVIASAEGDTP